MKRLAKLLFSIIGVILAIGTVVYLWQTKARAEATYHFANGVEVTTVDVQPDDTLTLLDAKIWKFDLILPNQNGFYNYTLKLYRHGQPVASLGGFGTGPVGRDQVKQHREVTVGIAPIDDTLLKAHQIRCSLQLDGGSTNGTFTNPFRNSDGYDPQAQYSPPDNQIYLMKSASRGVIYGSARDNDVCIALQIEPMAVHH